MSKERKFTIVHYVRTGKYYPKYGNLFLVRDWATGFVNQIQENYRSDCKSEHEARQVIKDFKSQSDQAEFDIIEVE